MSRAAPVGLGQAVEAVVAVGLVETAEVTDAEYVLADAIGIRVVDVAEVIEVGAALVPAVIDDLAEAVEPCILVAGFAVTLSALLDRSELGTGLPTATSGLLPPVRVSLAVSSGRFLSASLPVKVMWKAPDEPPTNTSPSAIIDWPVPKIELDYLLGDYLKNAANLPLEPLPQVWPSAPSPEPPTATPPNPEGTT